MLGWATLALPLGVCLSLVAAGLHVVPSGLAAVVVHGLFIMALERARPERAVPPQALSSRVRDLLSAIVFGGVLGLFAVVGAWLALDGLRAALGVHLALDVPAPLATLVVLFLGDGLDYVRHRVEHQSNGVLWRVHAVHHWLRHFTGVRGARIHPLEGVVVYGCYGLVAGFLGTSLDVALTAGVLAIIVMSSQHINADIELGALRWVIVHVDQHRWHHDVAPEHGEVCNFANVFTVWDLIGGTYRHPGRFRGEFGIAPFYDRYPDPLWAQATSVLRARHHALARRAVETAEG